MRSRTERRLALLITLLLTATAVPAAEQRTPLSPTEIDAAVQQGRADPDIGSETKSQRLRWIGEDKPQAPAKRDEPLAWLVNLFRFLGRTMSLVFWSLGFLAAGALGVWIYRAARARAPRVADPPNAGRSQVFVSGRRAGALPDDIGAAASGLLDAGRVREALSLLYRGALARAVDRHGIAIGEAATEGEVLRAVDGHLDAGRIDYLRKLVQLWQRAVYAGSPTAAEAVRPLCVRFRGLFG